MHARSSARHALAALASLAIVLAALGPALAVLDGPPQATSETDETGHLVVSEVMTGGSSGSDEFVELYNPTGGELPLEGLELIYVTASGATVTRKAAWEAGAAGVPPGGHLLVANEAGIFAAIADATYANGLSATGGSMALRIQGASSAIDAIGWGTAASGWLETAPADAPPGGSSLERLPGGSFGSGQDTDDNRADFWIRPDPDPQNAAAPPVPPATSAPSPSGTPTPSPSSTPTATPSPMPSPTGSPGPSLTAAPTPMPLTVAQARSLPDGSSVTVIATALTGNAFSEGGGYVADATGGIAVLLSDGGFPRGPLLQVSGTVDDRYHQRTIRAAGADVLLLGDGSEPQTGPVTTGEVGEPYEGTLVRISGMVLGSPTTLSAGLAFEVDDGSGPTRVVVGTETGIDTEEWSSGTTLDLVGVVGQRDSTGGGTAGYRVQPRDPGDVLHVAPPATPTPGTSSSPGPSPSSSPSASPSPSAAPGPSLVPIADARALESGSRVRVRGVVTLSPGLVDEATAVVQDGSGAIVIRLSDEAGSVVRGELLELVGVRSTLRGMLTLRVVEPPLRLGNRAEPTAARVPTGVVGEDREALLVTLRGAVATGPVRSSAGSVYFDLDDGTGPLRVFFRPAAEISLVLERGDWLELTGIVGQETSGQQPLRGYRLWPRDDGDVRLVAPATTAGGDRDAPGEGAEGSTGTAAGRAPLPAPPGAGADPRPAPVLVAAPHVSEAPSPTAAAEAPPAPASPGPDPLRAVAVAVLGLSGSGTMALVAWRRGTLARLAALLSPEEPEGEEEPRDDQALGTARGASA